MERLINAVDNLREDTRRQNANASGSQVSKANRQSSQSTESEMRRLYPRINSNVRTNVNVAPPWSEAALVPQIGTILLFLVYINDLPNCLNRTSPRLFADDTNLTATGESISDVEMAMNSDLEDLRKWLMPIS